MRGEKPTKDPDSQGYAGAMPQTEMGAGIAASPHLHRAKDLPVFASLTTRRPSAFRSLLTSSGVASNRGPARRQVLDLPRPFLGRVLPRRLPPGGAANCVRSTNSSGASSGGPTWASPPHRHPVEIGPSATCRTFLPLPAFWGGGDFRPDHPCNLQQFGESGKRKKRVIGCG